MNPQQFCYWLQGMTSNKEGLSAEETSLVKSSLSQVFLNHIDPSYPANVQQALSDAHQGNKNEGNQQQSNPPKVNDDTDWKGIRFRC
jgi:hypothetical protein